MTFVKFVQANSFAPRPSKECSGYPSFVVQGSLGIPGRTQHFEKTCDVAIKQPARLSFSRIRLYVCRQIVSPLLASFASLKKRYNLCRVGDAQTADFAHGIESDAA